MRVMSFKYEAPIPKIPAGDSLLLTGHFHVRSLACASGATTWREKLELFEFLWPLQGKFRLARGQTLIVGDLALFPPGAEMVFDVASGPAQAIVIEFEIRQYPASWGKPNSWPRLIHLRDGDVCGGLLNYLCTLETTPDILPAQAALTTLLSAFVTGNTTSRGIATKVLSSQTKAALREIRRRLAAAPSARISLKQIAAKAGLSCDALNNHFRRCVGRTPIAEVYLARLDRAVELLARTDMPLGVVAEMAGFCDGPHLAKYCRAQFGMTTAALRYALQSGSIPRPAPRSPLLQTTPIFLTPPKAEALPKSARQIRARKYRRRRRHDLLLERMRKMIEKRTPETPLHDVDRKN